MIDAEYAELDVEHVVNWKPPQEDHTQVERTLIQEKHLNEVPQQTGDETHTSYPSPFP